MKVKVFKFKLSTNISGKKEKGDDHHVEKDIEGIINKFIQEKDVVSISVNNSEIQKRIGQDTFIIIYTILYKEIQ